METNISIAALQSILTPSGTSDWRELHLASLRLHGAILALEYLGMESEAEPLREMDAAISKDLDRLLNGWKAEKA